MEGKKVEQYYTPPPKLGKWEGFRVFVWNSETGQFLGRTGASWGKLSLRNMYFTSVRFITLDSNDNRKIPLVPRILLTIDIKSNLLRTKNRYGERSFRNVLCENVSGKARISGRHLIATPSFLT